MIASNETRLTGKWLTSEGKTVEDETCQRVTKLVNVYLVKLGDDPSGWETLYRDPKDGRLWELTYPQSEMHGGGPPELRYLSQLEAAQKYGSVARVQLRRFAHAHNNAQPCGRRRPST
jgi:hypothetical protein